MCQETFRRRMELRVHMVSHTGEMPYKVRLGLSPGPWPREASHPALYVGWGQVPPPCQPHGARPSLPVSCPQASGEAPALWALASFHGGRSTGPSPTRPSHQDRESPGISGWALPSGAPHSPGVTGVVGAGLLR